MPFPLQISYQFQLVTGICRWNNRKLLGLKVNSVLHTLLDYWKLNFFECGHALKQLKTLKIQNYFTLKSKIYGAFLVKLKKKLRKLQRKILTILPVIMW